MGITSLTQVDYVELAMKHTEIVLGRLVLGHHITYGEREYPGENIREYPDGRRVSLRVTVEDGVSKVRDIPPRDHMNPDRIEKSLARRGWASYLDPEYLGVVVREYPDGRRITLHPREGAACTEGREIPPRKDATPQPIHPPATGWELR